MCDTCVEPDAGDIEEKVTIELARIDQSRSSLEHHVKRGSGIERHSELTSQTVAGSARNDRERRIGADQCRSNLVNRAVAAPGDKGGDTTSKPCTGKLARVTGVLGDKHFRVQRPLLDERRCLLRAHTSDVATPACARYRVDDDRDFLSGATSSQDAATFSA